MPRTAVTPRQRWSRGLPLNDAGALPLTTPRAAQGVRWTSMTVAIRGENRRGETVAFSFAGKPTRAQLAMLLDLFDAGKETDE